VAWGLAASIVMPTTTPWLGEATQHRDGGEDSTGRRVAIARVAFDALSSDADLPPGTGEITITSDETGLPIQVPVEAESDGVAVTSTYELGNAGEAVTIQPPAADALDPTPYFDEEDLAVTRGPPRSGSAASRSAGS
jgi:hypothetical protein